MAIPPVTTGTYANNESLVFKYLGEMGLNLAAACGVLANIERESGFRHNVYGDGGTSYGLCQWHASRFTALKKYVPSSWNTVAGQMKYLKYELQNSYRGVWNTLTSVPNTESGAYDAAYKWCTDFERPADMYNKARERGNIAKSKYWSHYSKYIGVSPGGAPTAEVLNTGQKIVQIAKRAVGLKYIEGGEMYDTKMGGADAPGLVYYCYHEVGQPLKRGTVMKYYDLYRSSAKSVVEKDVCAADLLFYKNTKKKTKTEYDHIAIANGDGGRIHSKEGVGIVEETDLGNPDYIMRILSDAETSQGYVPDMSEVFVSLNPSAYAYLTSTDPYSSIVEDNLSKLEAEGFDYGYLIDMTNGGDFRFYIPEFSEQAGAKWNPIDIRGRSVDIQSYESTNSRVITISLGLYAGVGLYKARSGESGEDTVTRLHKDAYFLKSLEYPDYTNVITKPPAVVHLILGSAVNLTGIVSNVIVEHLKPFDDRNRAMYLKVAFTVTQIAVNPIDYRDVRKGQYTISDTSDIESISMSGTELEKSTNAPVYAGGE